MRIKEEFKRLGYFWIPSIPDRKAPGTLSISDGGSIQLEVIHLLGERGATFNDDPKRIVGQIEKEGFVTLDRCSYNNIGGSGGIFKPLFDVNRAFTGVTYQEDETPRFNTLTFSIEGIDEWIGISHIEADLQFEKRTATISYEPLVDVSLNLDNGMQLLITPRLTFGGEFSIPKEEEISPKDYFEKEAKVTQKTYFELVSQDARELDEFTSVTQKITAFLCFAINEIVSLDSMSATSDNPHRDIEQGTTRMCPENIYYSSWPYSKDEPKINQHNMLFGFQKMTNDAERIINKWIAAYEQIEPALNLYLLAKMGVQPSPKETFLTLAQGLEACHRRTSDEKRMDEVEFKELVKNLIDQCPEDKKQWLDGKLSYGNELSLRDRMKSIIKPFNDIIGTSKKRKELIKSIVDTRNYLTHYNPSLKPRITKGEHLPFLCSKMELLFQLHILQFIGFSQEDIDSIVDNCEQFVVWKL